MLLKYTKGIIYFLFELEYMKQRFQELKGILPFIPKIIFLEDASANNCPNGFQLFSSSYYIKVWEAQEPFFFFFLLMSKLPSFSFLFCFFLALLNHFFFLTVVSAERVLFILLNLFGHYIERGIYIYPSDN